jgi:hypothetical protein
MRRPAHPRSPTLSFADAEVDLVPMIDCIFLLLLFFMLCGRITIDTRVDQISVPPATTGEKDINRQAGWTREVLNVFADHAGQGANRLVLGTVFDSLRMDHDLTMVRLRHLLDAVYDRAETYPAADAPGLRLPMVIIEIRADGDVDVRRIQELEMLLADSIVPATGMPTSAERIRKPFVNLAFTTRPPVP